MESQAHHMVARKALFCPSPHDDREGSESRFAVGRIPGKSHAQALDKRKIRGENPPIEGVSFQWETQVREPQMGGK